MAPMITQNPWQTRNFFHCFIEFNKAFGFRIIRRRKGMYYENPSEPTVVMELTLTKARCARTKPER
jgi:hypothetical protein